MFAFCYIKLIFPNQLSVLSFIRMQQPSLSLPLSITPPHIHQILVLYGDYFNYKIYVSQYIWLEKDMATHSSVLAWRIPGMGEPGGLPSMGSHRVRHDWSNLAATAIYLSIITTDWLSKWNYSVRTSTTFNLIFNILKACIIYTLVWF